jgi:phosphoglycerate dehydrogenase-like enzyme
VRFTCAKSSFAKPVAEHALALSLALARVIPERARATSWGSKAATTFYGANILIIGAGGIAQEFLKFLAPFNAHITVMRNTATALSGVDRVIHLDQLDEAVAEADLVVIACALTSRTRNLFDSRRIALMKKTSLLVNVARGEIVNTEDLVQALNDGTIAGAALDVTFPEPLPEGHALWTARNALITPHTADTPELTVPLFAQRIRENIAAYRGRSPWVGVVDPILGY